MMVIGDFCRVTQISDYQNIKKSRCPSNGASTFVKLLIASVLGAAGAPVPFYFTLTSSFS